jgi:hypothetical protein
MLPAYCTIEFVLLSRLRDFERNQVCREFAVHTVKATRAVYTLDPLTHPEFPPNGTCAAQPVASGHHNQHTNTHPPTHDPIHPHPHRHPRPAVLRSINTRPPTAAVLRAATIVGTASSSHETPTERVAVEYRGRRLVGASLLEQVGANVPVPIEFHCSLLSDSAPSQRARARRAGSCSSESKHKCKEENTFTLRKLVSLWDQS